MAVRLEPLPPWGEHYAVNERGSGRDLGTIRKHPDGWAALTPDDKRVVADGLAHQSDAASALVDHDHELYQLEVPACDRDPVEVR